MSQNQNQNDSIAFIDGDVLCHKIGNVGQITSVQALDSDNNLIGEFKNKTEAYDQLGRDDIIIETKIEPKPWEQVKKIGKAMVRNITNGAGVKRFRIYIDGEGNFRKGAATIRPYKGTRSSPKPFYFNKLREWLLEDMGAIEIPDMEADDAISIAMYYGYKKGKKYIGCTNDKDAKNTPGWLYNWDKMEEPEYISEIQANRNFFTQMLTGDTIDNIQGCRQCGAKAKEVQLLENVSDPYEMFEIVYKKYVDKANKSGYTTNILEKELSPLEEILENGVLLWMLRNKQIEPWWHPVTHLGIDRDKFDKLVEELKC